MNASVSFKFDGPAFPDVIAGFKAEVQRRIAMAKDQAAAAKTQKASTRLAGTLEALEGMAWMLDRCGLAEAKPATTLRAIKTMRAWVNDMADPSGWPNAVLEALDQTGDLLEFPDGQQHPDISSTYIKST